MSPVARAVGELAAAIACAQAADPLAPVTVVPPSAYSGLHLRRRLATRPGGRGLVNVRFYPLARLAEGLVSAEGVAARPPLMGAARLLATRMAMEAAPAPWPAFARHGATVEAVSRALRDGSAAGEPPGLLEPVRVAYDAVTIGFRDDAEGLLRAAEMVRAGHPLVAEGGPILLFMPPRQIPPAEEAFLAAYRERGLVTEIRAPEGRAEMTATIAPCAETEVRAAVHRTLESGVPLHRVAFLFRAGGGYDRIVADALARAELPSHGRSARTLAHTAAGRAILGLLALDPERLTAADLRAFLAENTVGLDGAQRPGRVWERLVRSHRGRGVASLAVFEGELAEWALALASWAEGRPRRATWSTYVTAAGGFERFVRLPVDPDTDAVRAALRGLAACEGLRSECSREEFVAALESTLKAPAPRAEGDRLGEGAFIGRIDDARGLEFDVVHLLGLAEGLFPAPSPADPLRPHRQIEPGAEAARLADALACAPLVHVSRPRVIAGARREAYPSEFWPQDAACEEVLSLPHALLTRPCSESDGFLRASSTDDDRIGPSRRRHVARAAEGLSEYEGMVGPGPVPTLNPSAIERFADCPFSFFLRHGLGIRADRGGERGRADRGEAWHRALATFFQHHPAPASVEGWTGGDIDTLRACLEAELDADLRDGKAEPGLAADHERRADLARVEGFLSAEHRARGDRRVLATEHPFHLVIEVAGAAIEVEGTLDRLDSGSDGVKIVDYKTGKGDWYKKLGDEDPLCGARAVQLPLYARAAGATSAAYWMIDADGEKMERAITPALAEDALEEFLGAVVAAIRAGHFPATTSRRSAGADCPHCDYRVVCPADRSEAWERKASFPDLTGLRQVFGW